MWDSAVAAANKAATQAGQQAQIAATKAKLHADILVVDRDITSRKEKFGVELYGHLEAITSTQEFYVADDRLINVIRPTLIKCQREVAAYQRKRDALLGKVTAAEANRSGTASIFGAATLSEKIMNAAKYAAAGAKEAASKTELAMLDRQILGFKEEFGTEMYPVFQSMEDNEGWLPTDRKVRSLYDAAREDIADMEKAKDSKREQMKQLDGVEGSGLTPPSVPAQQPVSPAPTVVAAPVQAYSISQAPANNKPSWTAPLAQPVVANGYGTAAIDQTTQIQQPKAVQQDSSNSGFGFIQQSAGQSNTMNTMPQHASSMQQCTAQPQQQPSMNGVFDPFDGIGGTASTSTSFPQTASEGSNSFDPFAAGNGQQQPNLSAADMNLFKY
mmetsp:Transcript_23878/g.56520  ORF Transcript_23878/g.56520 Transcript_23878/m.56520 type:complete len:386 (+) Transcript_23878:260-1417(+)